MISPTGIIAEALMYPECMSQVMQFLKDTPGTGSWKREVLQGWARVVGVKVSQAQYRAVFMTGHDVQ
jgi:hypothetical protein